MTIVSFQNLEKLFPNSTMELSLKHMLRTLHRPTPFTNNHLLPNSFHSVTTTILSKTPHPKFHFQLNATAPNNTTSPAIKIHKKQLTYTNNRSKQEEEEEEEEELISSSDEFEDDDEDEDEYDDDEEEEDSETSSVLSLNVKPDRNMALLDEFEMDGELPTDPPNHKSGYVAVVGKPNVGKSTLSNQMIGQKLSIVTDKPQTTRHRILGICSEPEYQFILYDTPGVIEKEMHKLDSMMMKNVRNATVDADCILVVVDACKMPKNIDDLLPKEMTEEGKKNVPILLVLNKRDLIKPGEIAKKLEWYEKNTNVDEVIPVSAKFGQGVADVKEWILSKIPLGPTYYPKDITSEHPERFFVGEIVREKIFVQYRNEVPYACQVNVVNYKARPGAKDFIQVEIVVEKNSQKIIIIGRNGESLKTLATAARLDIEDFLQKKVYLEIEVKVKEKWRQDEGLLKYYGYDGKIRVFGT